MYKNLLILALFKAECIDEIGNDFEEIKEYIIDFIKEDISVDEFEKRYFSNYRDFDKYIKDGYYDIVNEVYLNKEEPAVEDKKIYEKYKDYLTLDKYYNNRYDVYYTSEAYYNLFIEFLKENGLYDLYYKK